LARLRLNSNIIKDEMDTAVLNQEFVRAQEKKLEFERISEELKNLLGEIEQATAVHVTPKVNFLSLSFIITFPLNLKKK
jgi:hypothetical protein